MKIKIKACSNKNNWYKNEIGKEFEVTKKENGLYYLPISGADRFPRTVLITEAEEIGGFDKTEVSTASEESVTESVKPSSGLIGANPEKKNQEAEKEAEQEESENLIN